MGSNPITFSGSDNQTTVVFLALIVLRVKKESNRMSVTVPPATTNMFLHLQVVFIENQLETHSTVSANIKQIIVLHRFWPVLAPLPFRVSVA